MVNLSTIRASNAQVASSLPPNLVAVFVGATSGIGEISLKQFAKHTAQPRAYFLGRNEAAGERIKAECRALNPKGEFIFIKADVSLIHNVDEVCRDLKTREKTINLLFLSAGTVDLNIETSEDLHQIMALGYFGRIRFILNLLPLLRQARSLRRVIVILAGTKEGAVNMDDFQCRKASLGTIMTMRPHAASIMTLALEHVARQAPEVSFIHDYPGFVVTGLVANAKGVFAAVMRVLLLFLGPLISIPIEQSGERHLFVQTSARYPSAEKRGQGAGVALGDGVEVARGTDGQVGGGVYSVDENGESASVKAEAALAQLREKGVDEQVWQQTMDEFKRITGVEVI